MFRLACFPICSALLPSVEIRRSIRRGRGGGCCNKFGRARSIRVMRTVIDVIAVLRGAGGNPPQKYGIFIWRKYLEARLGGPGNMLTANCNVPIRVRCMLLNPGGISHAGLEKGNPF